MHEETIRTYANRIQVLALANTELAEENHRLRDRLNKTDVQVTKLIPSPPG